jgi:hypothetical protein
MPEARMVQGPQLKFLAMSRLQILLNLHGSPGKRGLSTMAQDLDSPSSVAGLSASITHPTMDETSAMAQRLGRPLINRFPCRIHSATPQQPVFPGRQQGLDPKKKRGGPRALPRSVRQQLNRKVAKVPSVRGSKPTTQWQAAQSSILTC